MSTDNNHNYSSKDLHKEITGWNLPENPKDFANMVYALVLETDIEIAQAQGKLQVILSMLLAYSEKGNS
ncbi:hypothetical protein [Paenibacillus sp. sgz500992]|uniref:hypothetical protein n=1 Tax=Paenibacillus sp. sgz500992 TaxID=3242476 RepID=UPI0036D39337